VTGSMRNEREGGRNGSPVENRKEIHETRRRIPSKPIEDSVQREKERRVII